MAVPATTKPITIDDVRAVDGLDEYKGMEIVGGVWTPKHKEQGVSAGHGRAGARILRAIGDYLDETQLGEVYQAETIYFLYLKENGVWAMRKPDVSFVRAEHVRFGWGEYYFLAPDLAVEVLSPSDEPAVLNAKLSDYFQYGTWQVWLIDHTNKTIIVRSPDGSVKTYGVGDKVPGGYLLPEFELDVTMVFREPILRG